MNVRSLHVGRLLLTFDAKLGDTSGGRQDKAQARPAAAVRNQREFLI